MLSSAQAVSTPQLPMPMPVNTMTKASMRVRICFVRFLFVFLILFLLSFHLYFASGLFSMIAFRSLAIIYVNTLLCVVNKFIGVCPLLLQPMPPALLLPLLARGFACGIPYAALRFSFRLRCLV